MIKIKHLRFEIASIFHRSFQKVLKKYVNHQKLTQENCSKMQSFFITYEDMKNSINHLKYKIIRTPENIPPYFIKYAIPSIIFPLSLVVNCSKELAEVPTKWKMFFIIPVYKKGNKHNALNYRPISLTSSFSRTFERIMSIKILNHIFESQKEMY